MTDNPILQSIAERYPNYHSENYDNLFTTSNVLCLRKDPQGKGIILQIKSEAPQIIILYGVRTRDLQNCAHDNDIHIDLNDPHSLGKMFKLIEERLES